MTASPSLTHVACERGPHTGAHAVTTTELHVTATTTMQDAADTLPTIIATTTTPGRQTTTATSDIDRSGRT